MQTSHRSSLAVALFLLAAGESLLAQQLPPDGVKFEIVSVRSISASEAAERSPDFVGPNVVVRLRLSCASQVISFYTWRNSAIPADYKIEQTELGVVWLYGNGGTTKRSTSPGLRAVLFGSTGEWTTLPAFSSVEWEEIDTTTSRGKKHAFTLFIKGRSTDEPKEVASEWFVVPQSYDPGK